MYSTVIQEFFLRRQRVADVMKVPIELVGIYYVSHGNTDCSFGIGKMLKPHPKWDKNNCGAYLGYTQNAPQPNIVTVREYFGEALAPTASFFLGRLPGCCGAAHVHDIYTCTPGLGQICLEIAEKSAYSTGYRLITGTVIDKGVSGRARHLVAKYDWKEHHSFVNQRTGNTVYLVSKELTATNAGRRIDDGASKSSNESGSVKIATVARSAGFSAQ